MPNLKLPFSSFSDDFVNDPLGRLFDGVGAGVDRGSRCARRVGRPAGGDSLLIGNADFLVDLTDRDSLAFVRSCVSSSERESVSTLLFTWPTSPRTNFLVAHAVVPPRASASTGTARTTFFMTQLLQNMNLAFYVGTRTPDAYADRRSPGLRLYRCRATSGDGAPPPAVYPLRARTMCSRSRARTSNASPACSRRRLEREHVLVPHLADDLPRRDARVRRRDREEEVAASPSRQIREPAAERPGAVIRIPRVVDRRHHRDDVDRHVDAAGDGSTLPAPSTGSSCRCRRSGRRLPIAAGRLPPPPPAASATALAVSAIAS